MKIGDKVRFLSTTGGGKIAGMNVCVLLSIIMGKQFGGFMVQLMNKLAIVFALIVVPFFLYKKILNVELDNIKIKYFRLYFI